MGVLLTSTSVNALPFSSSNSLSLVSIFPSWSASKAVLASASSSPPSAALKLSIPSWRFLSIYSTPNVLAPVSKALRRAVLNLDKFCNSYWSACDSNEERRCISVTWLAACCPNAFTVSFRCLSKAVALRVRSSCSDLSTVRFL